MKKFIAQLLIVLIFGMSNPALCTAKNSSPRKTDVKMGTTITLIVPYMKTSKNTITGEQINAEIEHDVIINNVKVFKKGDSALLNVVEAKKAGFIGKPGEIQIVNGTVQDANGETRNIRFYHKFTGEEKTYPKVMLGISIFFLWPLALAGFVKGGEAKLLMTAPVNVMLIDEFVFEEKL